MDRILLSKLKKSWDDHKSIIVGVDFDDTVFPFNNANKENVDRCALVRALLTTLKSDINDYGGDCCICLYTVADAQSLPYKIEIMKLYGLEADFVNEGPLDEKWGNPKKPFFNILLDDKAGLNESIEVLEELLIFIQEYENLN